MHLPHVRPRALYAAFDQVAFFASVFLLTYASLLVCGHWVAPARYLVFVLFWLPLVVPSAVFAGQLSANDPPPVARRDRFSLREIRPQEPFRRLPRRAA